jgi:N-methylhydantoinase B
VAAVVRDVEWGKVSVDGARTDYGVVLTVADGVVTVDDQATDSLRAEQRSRRTGDEPFFDRGPGYARLSGGKAFADVDVL